MYTLYLKWNRAAAKRKKQGASYSLGDGELFGRLVRVVGGEGEWRECETCHKKSHVKKMLLNNPDLGRGTLTSRSIVLATYI